MSTAQEAYVGYQTMVTQTNEGMAELEAVCQTLELEEHKESLAGRRERMKNKLFSVGIMGEFRRGKSTVINSLLGQEIVPSDIVPTSATLNYIRWDAKPSALVNFKDGTSKQIGIEELSDYVTKITAESERMAESVEDAVVNYPCRFCQNGVQIIDTPGLNDDERMNSISENVVPNLDAIIMVLVPDSPFSMSEAEFVRTKVMTSDLGRIIFVVNKIDTLTEKKRDKLLAYLKDSIRDSVLGKMEEMYGKDSDEYREAQNKVADIHIIGISAQNALEGRLDDDEELVEKSNIKEFEAMLSRLLTEERGLLELVPAVNNVLAVAKEAKKAVEMRRGSLTMDKEELERVSEESLRSIEESREKKREELSNLKKQASTIYEELLPTVEAEYDKLDEKLKAYIEELAISPSQVQSTSAAEAVAVKLNQEINDKILTGLSEACEKLAVQIKNHVGKDVGEFNGKLEGITTTLEKNKQKLAGGKGKQGDNTFDWGVAAVDALTNFMGLYGIGGIVTGFKENGAKGAVVGGVSGFLAGNAAIYGLVAAAATAGVLSTTVILPIVAIGGVVSTFSGKMAVRQVFKKNVGEKSLRELMASLHMAE